MVFVSVVAICIPIIFATLRWRAVKEAYRFAPIFFIGRLASAGLSLGLLVLALGEAVAKLAAFNITKTDVYTGSLFAIGFGLGQLFMLMLWTQPNTTDYP